MSYTDNHGWLIFFSSLPSKPVGHRVKVWRRLSKAGAIQLKGAVYLLPASDEHAELFQWLTAEVTGMGGEAAWARTPRIESLTDAEIVALFERRKEGEYREVGRQLDLLERRLDGARQGGLKAARGLASIAGRIRRDFEERRRTDFFSSAAGAALGARIDGALAALEAFAGAPGGPAPPAILPRSAADYRDRLWVTRPGPFVDRMASAWLIRRFVDTGAAFDFAEERSLPALPAGTVTFDVPGGEFTHAGDLCTFEVLLRAFGLSDPALAGIAAIVHELDVSGERRQAPEAAGLEAILTGIRRSARDDRDALERGMAVFEMLCAAKSPEAARGADD
jgi:hypothetical protein